MKILRITNLSISVELKDETPEEAEDRILDALEPFCVASYKTEIEEYDDEKNNDEL